MLHPCVAGIRCLLIIWSDLGVMTKRQSGSTRGGQEAERREHSAQEEKPLVVSAEMHSSRGTPSNEWPEKDKIVAVARQPQTRCRASTFSRCTGAIKVEVSCLSALSITLPSLLLVPSQEPASMCFATRTSCPGPVHP